MTFVTINCMLMTCENRGLDTRSNSYQGNGQANQQLSTNNKELKQNQKDR